MTLHQLPQPICFQHMGIALGLNDQSEVAHPHAHGGLQAQRPFTPHQTHGQTGIGLTLVVRHEQSHGTAG